MAARTFRKKKTATKSCLFRRYFLCLCTYQCKPREGEVRARGGDLTNFRNFWIKFPRVGNEKSIKSVKKAPTPGEKSKQTILYKTNERTFQKYVLTTFI